MLQAMQRLLFKKKPSTAPLATYTEARIGHIRFRCSGEQLKLLQDNREAARTLLHIVSVVEKLEAQAGQHFDPPYILSDTPSPTAFASCLGMTGKACTAHFSIPMAALTAQPPLDEKVLVGIIGHELGHAHHKKLTLDISKLQGWESKLHHLATAPALIRAHPGAFSGQTYPLGGEEAFRDRARFLFAEVQKGMGSVIKELTANNMAYRPEILIDKLRFSSVTQDSLHASLAALARLDTPDNRATLATCDRIIKSAKENGMMERFELSAVASPLQIRFLRLLSQLHNRLKHAEEFMADDFAVIHAENPVNYLKYLLHTGHADKDSFSHPSLSSRLQRADLLDSCRIQQLEKHGIINNDDAVREVNRLLNQQARRVQRQTNFSR